MCPHTEMHREFFSSSYTINNQVIQVKRQQMSSMYHIIREGKSTLLKWISSSERGWNKVLESKVSGARDSINHRCMWCKGITKLLYLRLKAIHSVTGVQFFQQHTVVLYAGDNELKTYTCAWYISKLKSTPERGQPLDSSQNHRCFHHFFVFYICYSHHLYSERRKESNKKLSQIKQTQAV